MSRSRRRGGRVDAEVIDLRTIVPVDIETIEELVKKTDVASLCTSDAHGRFRRRADCAGAGELLLSSGSADQRVTGWDTPYPHSMEWAYFPGPARLGPALRSPLED